MGTLAADETAGCRLKQPARRGAATMDAGPAGAAPSSVENSMRLSLPLLACLLAGLALPALPAAASTSASSASSEGISASVGSVSTSIEGSSNSSSPGGKTAEGPYRVIHVAAAPDRPGLVRVALEPVQAGAGGQAFALLLPEATAASARLAAGDVIVATAREYGVQFARADAAEPFFLVVDDRQLPELKTRAIAG